MSVRPLRIVAPACSAEEGRALLGAGADELYCGAMPDEWVATLGDSDLLSRRQGRLSHVAGEAGLAAIAGLTAETGHPVALTLNARYSPPLVPGVLRLAQLWEELGGTAALVTDLGLLLALRERGSRLRRHLSLLAGVFNSASAAWFRELGASRVVLPRDLTLAEIRSLIEGGPPMEYEALVMNQKCQFIDGLCGFHHAVRLPEDVPAAFDYATVPGETLPVVWSGDPDYEGHGCALDWETGEGPVRPLRRDDAAAPHCAACALPQLRDAGVGFLKIAGRGYPTELLVRSVRFLREALGIWDGGGPPDAAREGCRARYARLFGSTCEATRCYYAALPGRRTENGSAGASPSQDRGDGTGDGSAGASPSQDGGGGTADGSAGASPSQDRGDGTGDGSAGASPSQDGGGGT